MRDVAKLAALSLIVAIGYSREIPLSPQQMADLGVATAPLTRVNTVSQANLAATVIVPPRQLSLASPQYAGILQKTLVAVGDPVRAGQAVAVVASTEGVTLQRDYLQTAARYQRQKELAAKDERLYKEGIISERQYLATKQEADLLAADLGEKESMMRVTGVRRPAKASAIGATTTVTAPIGGIVTEQTALLGQRVDAMAPIYKIADLSTLWVEIQAPAATARAVKPGDTVRLSTGATAVVSRIAAGIESLNQAVLIRAKVTGGRDTLKPGQFVQAAIQTPSAQGLSIPKSGLIRTKGANYVFVKTAKGLTPVAVTVIKEECTSFAIAGPLRGDEQIAVRGIIALKGLWQESK